VALALALMVDLTLAVLVHLYIIAIIAGGVA